MFGGIKDRMLGGNVYRRVRCSCRGRAAYLVGDSGEGGACVESDIKDLANWDFLDVLFRFPVKGGRGKIKPMGFKTKHQVLDSVLYWIDVMREENLIPSYVVVL